MGLTCPVPMIELRRGGSNGLPPSREGDRRPSPGPTRGLLMRGKALLPLTALVFVLIACSPASTATPTPSRTPTATTTLWPTATPLKSLTRGRGVPDLVQEESIRSFKSLEHPDLHWRISYPVSWVPRHLNRLEAFDFEITSIVSPTWDKSITITRSGGIVDQEYTGLTEQPDSHILADWHLSTQTTASAANSIVVLGGEDLPVHGHGGYLVEYLQVEFEPFASEVERSWVDGLVHVLHLFSTIGLGSDGNSGHQTFQAASNPA